MTGNLVAAGADQSLAALHGDGSKALAGHEAALRDGVGILRQGGAVVSLGGAACGQLDGNGVNGQGSGLGVHGELGSHIVARGVLHNRRAGHSHGLALGNIGSLGTGGQAADGVGLAIHGEAQGLEAFNLQCSAVIGLAAAVGFHLDGILLGTVGHFQLAVVNRNVVVAFDGARVQGIGKDVVALTNGGLAAGVAVCRTLASHKAFAANGHFVLRQFSAIVLLVSGTGGQGHGALVDGQGTILGGHGELGSHIVARGVLHNSRAGYGNGNRSYRCVGCGCGSAQTLYGVILSVHREGEALKAAYGMLGAVIGEAAALGIDGDDILFAFAPVSNGQSAGLCGNGVVTCCRVVLQGVHGNGVIAGADQSLAALYGHRCQTFLADKLAVRDCIAAVCQGGAVIGLAAAGSGQLDGNGGNAQFPFLYGDGVVGSLEVFSLGIGDGVGHFILCHMGHGTGCPDVGDFVGYEAVAGNGDIGTGQGRAVIRLVVGSGGQGHGALLDGQGTLSAFTEVIVAGHVHTVAGNLVAGHYVVGGAEVGDGAFHGCGQHITLGQHALGVGVAAVGQGGSIVSLFCAVCGDHDGLAVGFNVQLTKDFRDGVVVRVEVFASGVHDCVLYRALGHGGDGTGCLNVGHFAVYKAVAGHGHFGVRQRSAVILLVVGSGGQSHGALVDDQLSVRCLGYDVLTGSIHRVHGAVGKLRIIGTCVGAGCGDGNTGEVRASGSTGVAFHSLLGAVIGPGLAVGGQLYILIVVEVDLILAGANGDGLAGIADRCAVRNRDGRLIQRLLEGQARNSLGFMYLLRGSVPVVVYGCGQVGAFGVVQVDHVLAGSNGQVFLIGAVVGITIDCNDFIGSRYGGSESHAILYLLSMQDAAGVLLQIVHRIAQVRTLGEGAGKGHIPGGHLEGAGKFRVVLIPAMENVAVRGSLARHGHIRAILVAFHSRQGRCAVGSRASVLVGHGVAVPGVVNINHGAAVSGNGLLVEALRGEARIDFGCCLGQFPGGTAHVVGIGQLIPVAFQILLVVLDGVCGSGCGVPLGGIGCVSGNGSGNGRIPSGKHIAGTGGSLTESGGCRAVAHIFGCPIFEHSLTDYAVRIGHGVGIPVIVNLNHGAAVGGNGHLVEVLRGKSGIRSGRRCGQFPGGTAHVVGIGQRIPVVCQILLVVLNLVRGIVPGNIVDRVYAAALHQRTRSGVDGILGIRLITRELVSRGRNTALGNGDHGRVVIDPRGTGYDKALLFVAVNGVTHGVLGGLSLAFILHVVQDNNGITCHLAALGGFRDHAAKFVTGVVLPCQRSPPNGDLIRVIYPHGLRIGIGLFHYTLDLVHYGVAYFLDLGLVLFPLSDIGHGAGNGCGNLRVPAHEGIAGTDRISPEQRGCIPVVQIVMNLILKDFLAVHTVGVSHGVVDVGLGVSCHVGNITHALAVIQRGTVFLYPTGKLIGKRRISRAGRIGRDGHRITVVIGFLADLGSVIVLIKDGVVDGLPFAGQGHVLGRHGKGAVGRNQYIIRSPALEGIAGSSSGRSNSDRLIILMGLLSGQGAGTGRGRSVVIGHLVAVCPVGNRYGYVLSGHGAGDNFHIRGIARDAGRRNTIVLFKVHGLGVGCCCLPAVLIYIIDGQIEGRLLPLGGEGHVVGGHGEGACLNFSLRNIPGSPADELIAVLRRNLGSDSDRGAFVLREGGSTVPLTAVQIVGHFVARNILGIESDVAVHRIGEVNGAAGTSGIGIPAVKGVVNAVLVPDRRQIGNSIKVTGLGGLAVLIVGGSFPLVAGGTGVPQFVGRGVNALRLDFHGAVHVHIGVGAVMSGNLIGLNLNLQHIIFGNGDAAKVRFHFGLVGVEDLRPVSAACGNHTALNAAGPADHAAGNAEAVFVVFVPGCTAHVYFAGAQTSASPAAGFVGIGILIRGSQVVELCLCGSHGRIRNGNGVIHGFLGTIGAGNRQRNDRLAGGNRSHKTGAIHSKDFIVAALPCHVCHVRTLRGNVRGKLGGRKGSHGIRTGQGHIRDRNSLLHGNGMGSSDTGRCIGDGDGSGARLHTGNETGLGHGEGFLIIARPSEVHLGTGRLGGCRQLGLGTHSYGLRTGDGEGRSLNRNFDSLGFIRMGMIHPAAVIAIGIGHGHGTCRQTLQSCRGSGSADFRLCRVAGFPSSGVITHPGVCIGRTSQGSRPANIDGLLGGSNARGSSLRIRSAGQQVAQLVQNAAALGLVFHGRLLRVGGGFRSDGLAGGLAGGFAGLDGGVVHVDNPALLRAVRRISHGGDAGGNAVDEGVQGVALGGGDGSGSEVIAGPAAALGKARGQNDGTAHGHTPIRIFLAFGQSSLGQSSFGQSSFGLGLLGLGRLRFLLRFRRNRVRGGSLLRRAAGLRHRRLGDHGLRFGHFRSGAVDREGAGGAERHDHAQSQESCNQSSLHGDVPPWIIYVKLTILYGNNGRGGRPFSQCTRSLYHAEL